MAHFGRYLYKFSIRAFWDERDHWDSLDCPSDLVQLAEQVHAEIDERSFGEFQQQETWDCTEAWMSKLHPGSIDASNRAVSLLNDLLSHSSNNPFQNAIIWNAEERSFFITKSGLMGMGPKTMKPGDIVVILFGGRTPYVLRPKEDGKHSFVGECYVRGLMFGEAIERMDRGEVQAKSFHLV